MIATPDARELLLIGGGHAHVAVLRAFAMRPLPGLRITVVSRELHTPYSGMLPGLVAGHYGFDDAHIDLGPLALAAGARLIHDEVTEVAAAARRVDMQSGRQLRFDWLSVNCGSQPDLQGVPDPDGCILSVKPIGQLLPALDTAIAAVGAGGSRHLAVVGGGAGGVELVLALAWRLRDQPAELRLLTAEPQILPGFNSRARRSLGTALAQAGVRVETGFRVTGVSAEGATNAAGELVRAETVLWCTGAAPPAWLVRSDLARDADGFLAVGATLQSVSHPWVWGAGDAVALTHAPRPRSGVFAVRAGVVLARNLRAAALGQRPGRYRPQRSFLSLVATGPRRAVAARGHWSAVGGWVWRWKDWIDRRFMARFRDLPTMDPLAPPPRPRLLIEGAGADPDSDPAMRCGGCGAKLGADLLERVLRDLDGQAGRSAGGRPIVRDDSALLTVASSDIIMTVDGFRAFVSDPWWFGRLAAVHALGDIHAMGGRPTAVLAHASVPFAADALMEDDLRQLMGGVLATLEAAGAQLIGGHSAEAAELAVSLTVVGEPHGPLLTRGGFGPGEVLVLTQPLGSGALLAAAMRGAVASRQVLALQQQMAQLSAAAASVLQAAGATAATDVTGFGLLGHLAEMARAAGCQVAVRAAAVPAFDGALGVLRAGIVSSLQRHNRLVLDDFDGATVLPRAVADLLCDPQTCGGLLAAIPAARSDQCIAALRAAGYPLACVIGEVLDQPTRPGQVGVIKEGR